MATSIVSPPGTTHGPAPRAPRPWWKKPLTWIITGITIVALGGTGLATYAAVSGKTTAAPKPASTATAKPSPKASAPRAAPAQPAPAAPAPAAPAPAPAVSKYARDIRNAGITAPASWIDKTGQRLVADWQAGYTAAWTDANVLGPGGVYPYHYAIFDQITERDFGVYPPAQGVQPSPAPAPQYTSAVAVVQQYYQDITDQNYAAAWALGGDNLNNGVGYDAWVAGYATTASISIDTYGTWSDGTVWCDISALQTDGTVKAYYGTYTVQDGQIMSANIVQTG